MKINIRKSAIRDLKKISASDKERIYQKIQELIYFPDVPNIKRLTCFQPAYRLRVGDWRILFDVRDDLIEIARILHRKDSYRRA